jgi:methanogenic corrinoid protein MtbC1
VGEALLNIHCLPGLGITYYYLNIEERVLKNISEAVNELVELISTNCYSQAELLLAEVFKAYPPETFLLQFLLPIQVELGELWHKNKITVASEHAATLYLRQYLDRMLSDIHGTKTNPLVICACAPSEMHELGNESLVYFLRKAGFNALFLGANLPEKDLFQIIDSLKPVAVCLSATTTFPAMRIVAIFKKLSAETSLILGYGGHFFDVMLEAKQRNALPGVFLGQNALVGSIILLEKFHSLPALSNYNPTQAEVYL